jgi:hypothetical protein
MGNSKVGTLRVVINDLAVGLVETGGQVLLGKCQSDRIRDTLAKRTCIKKKQTFLVACFDIDG